MGKNIVDFRKKLPLIVIVGPTASGKTSLAIEIAEEFNGEVVCADSRSIYRGANIGTAKPTLDEQKGVKHWGIDIVEPDEHFTAADFKKYANEKIAEIRSRGKLPILVGGTGLYVDAVIFDFNFGSIADSEKRDDLNKLSLEELHEYCKNNNISLPENDKNKRYVVRAIERFGQNLSRRDEPISNAMIIGILVEKSVLRSRIALRSEQFFNKGVIEEAKKLGEKYGWGNEAMKSNIYRLARSYLSGEISLSEMKIKNEILDWRLAKRQMTWQKRNKFIKWLPLREAKKYLVLQLAKII
jgi:tRNA dimethylallyltransferase